jgi:hypothetical protein
MSSLSIAYPSPLVIVLKRMGRVRDSGSTLTADWLEHLKLECIPERCIVSGFWMSKLAPSQEEKRDGESILVIAFLLGSQLLKIALTMFGCQVGEFSAKAKLASRLSPTIVIGSKVEFETESLKSVD